MITPSGSWLVSGATHSTTSDNSSSMSYTGSGSYTTPVYQGDGSPFLSATGTYNESGSVVYSSHLSSNTNLIPGGTLVVSGGGTSDLSVYNGCNYSGEGHNDDSETGANGASETADYTESGSSYSGYVDSSVMAPNFDGSWRKATETIRSSGALIATNGFTYFSDTPVPLSDGTTGHALASNTQISSYNYGYGGAVTINTAADNTATTMGNIHGGGTGTGTATSNFTWPSSVNITSEEAPTSVTSSDTFNYNLAWAENYVKNQLVALPPTSTNNPCTVAGRLTITIPGKDPFISTYSTGSNDPNFGPAAQNYSLSCVVNPTVFWTPNPNFGYVGQPPVLPQPHAIDNSADQDSDLQAAEALIFMAPPQAQKTFNQATFDRAVGTANALVGATTFGGFQSIGVTPYDPVEAAKAQQNAGQIIMIAGAVCVVKTAGDLAAGQIVKSLESVAATAEDTVIVEEVGPAVQAVEEGALDTVPEGNRITNYYPSNDGFLGNPESQVLPEGTFIDRYGGSELSRFFSPTGTPLAARSLPPGTAGLPLRAFEVLQPLEVEGGTVAPAFGQLGYGLQYRTELELQELLDQGFLREVTP